MIWWVRTLAGKPGKIAITAKHLELGETSVEIHAR
jgi:hypothetical protein